MHYLPPTPGFAFLDHTVIGCSLVRGTPYRYIGQTLEQRAECDGWPIRWSTQVSQDQPDVAVLVIGRWETVDRVNEGQWTHIGDPTFDAYLGGELERALNIVSSTGVRVVVATVPYSRGGEKPDGRLYPEDQPDRVNLWNTMLRKTVSHHPNVANPGPEQKAMSGRRLHRQGRRHQGAQRRRPPHPRRGEVVDAVARGIPAIGFNCLCGS